MDSINIGQEGLLYIVIDENKKAIGVSFGYEDEIKKQIAANHKLVLVTEENTPIYENYYYDGKKFVKELKDV